jgi:hypothetical protein
MVLPGSERRDPCDAEAFGRQKVTLQGYGGADRDRPVTVLSSSAV